MEDMERTAVRSPDSNLHEEGQASYSSWGLAESTDALPPPHSMLPGKSSGGSRRTRSVSRPPENAHSTALPEVDAPETICQGSSSRGKPVLRRNRRSRRGRWNDERESPPGWRKALSSLGRTTVNPEESALKLRTGAPSGPQMSPLARLPGMLPQRAKRPSKRKSPPSIRALPETRKTVVRSHWLRHRDAYLSAVPAGGPTSAGRQDRTGRRAAVRRRGCRISSPAPPGASASSAPART